MRKIFTLLRLTALGTLLALPFPAYASGMDIRIIFLDLIAVFIPVIAIVAILVVIIAGFILMTSNDEAALGKARNTLLAASIGGAIATIIWMIGPLSFVGYFYNGIAGVMMVNTGGLVGMETEGLADWIATMAVITGVVVIIIATLRAVASFGGDEAAYTKVRHAILYVIIGLMIIAAAYVFKNVFFFTGRPSTLLAYVGKIATVIIGIISTIAMAILIYAGLRMVISFGKEDEFTAAKSLALRVIVGLIIIALSYALVYIVSYLFNG
jgi:hypothetical protein